MYNRESKYFYPGPISSSLLLIWMIYLRGLFINKNKPIAFFLRLYRLAPWMEKPRLLHLAMALLEIVNVPWEERT